jgi:hypothetical protein
MSLSGRLGYILMFGGMVFLPMTISDAFLRQRNIGSLILNLVLLAMGILLLSRDDYIQSTGWKALWSSKWTSWRSPVGNGLIMFGLIQMFVSVLNLSSVYSFQFWWVSALLGGVTLLPGILLILTEREGERSA